MAPMMSSQPVSSRNESCQTGPRILYIDAYDSFSNNILDLLAEKIEDVSIYTIKIDCGLSADALSALLSNFDALVVGPGPGNPELKIDIGIVKDIWCLSHQNLLPVLGICLGFQSLALAFGASIEHLEQPRHGCVSKHVLVKDGADIYDDTASLEVTNYHSLTVNLHATAAEMRQDIWRPTKRCPELLPLAFDYDKINGTILMAIRHALKPFWGVQYHPESICTNEEGKKIIGKWWREAHKWNEVTGRTPRKSGAPELLGDCTPWKVRGNSSHIADGQTLLSELDAYRCPLRPSIPPISISSCETSLVLTMTHNISAVDLCEGLGLQAKDFILLESVMPFPKVVNGETIDSTATGRYSIVCPLIIRSTLRLRYRVGSRGINVMLHGSEKERDTSNQIPSSSRLSVWHWLARFMEMHKCEIKTPSPYDPPPFQGGLVGYFSYEMGLEAANIHTEASGAPFDMDLAFVQRSLVIDHLKGHIHIQSLLPNDSAWKNQVLRNIMRIEQSDLITPYPYLDGRASSSASEGFESSEDADFNLREDCLVSKAHRLVEYLDSGSLVGSGPEEAEYQEKIRTCQERIKEGDSYELCLTAAREFDLLRGCIGDEDLDWEIYKTVRKVNPATYAAYFRSTATTIVSSSPERFLRWSRDGVCEMKPMKGTVKKYNNASGSKVSLKEAEEILNTPKELGENLMITDLIRHDLYGVLGSGNVWVHKLLATEEHHSVYQLVSTIQGSLQPNRLPKDPRVTEKAMDRSRGGQRISVLHSNQRPSKTGLDILRNALPAGSMTGAPKRRSCEILKSIEKKPRGIYSGVIGYLDVGGGGDFSVIIRSAVKHEKGLRKVRVLDVNSEFREWHDLCSSEAKQHVMKRVDHWSIGAGGAITALSEPEAEFEERGVKEASLLSAFDPKYVASAIEEEKGKRAKRREELLQPWRRPAQAPVPMPGIQSQLTEPLTEQLMNGSRTSNL